MDRMNEITRLLERMIACGDSMADLGRALKDALPAGTEAEPALAAQPTAKDGPARTYEFAEVRKACAAKSRDGHTALIRELIGKYGADRLSDISEADYPALMADVEAIG